MVLSRWDAVEEFIRRRAEAAMSKELQVRVSIEKVFFRPIAGVMGVEGLKVFASDGAEWSSPYFASVEKITCAWNR